MSNPTPPIQSGARRRALEALVAAGVVVALVAAPLVGEAGNSSASTAVRTESLPIAELISIDTEDAAGAEPVSATPTTQAAPPTEDASVPQPTVAPAPAAAPAPQAAPAPSPAPEPEPAAPAVPADSVWDALSICESGGNWAMNSGNGFYGGIQFMHSTWVNMGGRRFAEYPHEATREQQIAVATELQARYGWGQWPACTAKLGLR